MTLKSVPREEKLGKQGRTIDTLTLSLSMMAYPLFTSHHRYSKHRGMARLFVLLAVKHGYILGLWGCCISGGGIQALMSSGGAEHIDGHVIAVKLGRGGAASMSPTPILDPLWLKATAACQRRTALRWHWQIPPPLHPPGQRCPPCLSGPAVTLSRSTCLTLAGSLFHG